MSAKSLSIYAQRAREMDDPLQASARYPNQREGERRAILDIARKLDLQPTDRLLDIGCGIGNLTIPLSYMVAETDAVDDWDCLRRLDERAPDRVHMWSGDFLAVRFGRRFDAVLAYAITHYLTDGDEVMRFVDKAIDLLLPGGRALFGDLPNVDLKKRTAVVLPSGMDAEWEARERGLPVDHLTVVIDDVLCLKLLAHCRARGFNAWLLKQPPGLAFNAREDLLVERPTD